MDYTERLYEIFDGKGPKNLRTIFDCDSNHWQSTTMDKKIFFLTKMIESGYPLKNWIDDYKEQFEKTHPHIINAISNSVESLLSLAYSQKLKFEIVNWLLIEYKKNLKMNLNQTTSIEEFAGLCIETLTLDKPIDEEFHYSNVPLCVIDSIFSIGVRYEGVKNVINKTSEIFNIVKYSDKNLRKDTTSQISTSEFLKLLGKLTAQELADTIFQNQQRTSSNNGILKADAVVQFLRILQQFKIEYFHDVINIFGNNEFENAIMKIKGQSSGISLKYFYMLAGNEDMIKPDRMILRFLLDKTSKNHSMNEAQNILLETSKIISTKLNRKISASYLDNMIWQYQRVQKLKQK